jgi:hypothetical protein
MRKYSVAAGSTTAKPTPQHVEAGGASLELCKSLLEAVAKSGGHRK